MKKVNNKSFEKLKEDYDNLLKDFEKIQNAFKNSELKNAKLINKNRLSEATIKVFKELGTFEGSEKSFEKVLSNSLKHIMTILNVEAATLFMVTESGNEIIFKVVKGPASKKLKGKKIPIDQGIVGWVIKYNKPYISSNVKNDPIWNNNVSEEFNINTQNILCVPLVASSQVLGAIELINKKDGEAFDKKDLDILDLLSKHLSTDIQNIKLRLDTKNREEQRKTLLEVSTILNSSLDPKTVIKRAIESATKLMNTEVGSLMLVDEATNELYFEVALGDKGDKVKEIRLKMGQGIAGWVAENGESVVIQDVNNDPRFFKGADKKSKFQTKNMICVPVKLKAGKVIGVLQAINKQNNQFYSKDDLEIFESLANQVAIAIENAKLYENLAKQYEITKNTFINTAEALAEAIEQRDPYTGGHTKRVTEFSLETAKFLNLEEEELFNLRLSSILHDVGKIGIDDSILRKQAKLDDYEYNQIKLHPVKGKKILEHIQELNKVLDGTYYHHERYDGKGYPEGIAKNNIPEIARIIAVSDTFDAMTSDRPYRKGLPDKVAIEELIKGKGTQFDPEIVDAFVKAYNTGNIKSAKITNEKGGADA